MLIKTVCILFSGLLTVFPRVFAPVEGSVNRTERPFRDEICLNGLWDFQPADLPQDYVRGGGVAPQLPLPSDNGWDDVKIRIPSPWNVNSFACNSIEGPDHRNYPSYPEKWDEVKMAWMRKSITIPQNWDGRRIELRFDAVAGDTQVYVNGQLAGSNFDIFLPFSLDITDLVEPGGKAEILVGVRSQSLFEDRSTVGRRIIPAGSMWGNHIAGIWQDVFVVALPKVHIQDVFVKPLVSRECLEFDVTVANDSDREAKVSLSGNVREWIDKSGTDILSAPDVEWELGAEALHIPSRTVKVGAGKSVTVTLSIPVQEGMLKYWTPEHPDLYAALLTLSDGRKTSDVKYERFGWREWTVEGSKYCLNGKPYALRGDSWHFMGIPQMTPRYAWAWFRAIKEMNGNAVRPHAQVYPKFYLDMADRMGICVLDETANWASDGGPKLDSDHFWEASVNHLSRMVLRDRNHPSIFGWSISNENKPVILYVYNRSDLMPLQVKAWEQWRDTVRALDPTRPWISSDGEDDGDGILPVTVGHYGDEGSMMHWKKIGKPWGIGEHSMAYYGTPEQVSKYNGQRAYESQLGRMEGLANECYHLITSQRREGASYSTVFNMAWYALKPLPLGKKDISVAPTLEDGIHFTYFKEGEPGVQPERMGPYCTTFNPGYDPSLPLYETWPMFEAMRAANAPDGPQWCRWAEIDKADYEPLPELPHENYDAVIFIGGEDSQLYRTLEAQKVIFSDKPSGRTIVIADASQVPSEQTLSRIEKLRSKGCDLWLYGITSESSPSFGGLLPLPIRVLPLERSSFIPQGRSWMRPMSNSDFYFCEIQTSPACRFVLDGAFVEEGEVLLEACRTDWRRWNKRPEELKTAAVLRSENEYAGPLAAFAKYNTGSGSIYVSTLTDFALTDKGAATMSAILRNAGIPSRAVREEKLWEVRDGRLVLSPSAREKVKNGKIVLTVYSPRPLDDLLIEPDMPKLTLVLGGRRYEELQLRQGWNRLEYEVDPQETFSGWFECLNRPEFISGLSVRFTEQ